jgi:hypothetical protein
MILKLSDKNVIVRKGDYLKSKNSLYESFNTPSYYNYIYNPSTTSNLYILVD